MAADAAEVVGENEFLLTVGRSVDCFVHCGNQCEGFPKVQK